MKHIKKTWHTIIGGWKKYACTSFLLINILIGSSFAYPVFGNSGSFISPASSDEIMLAEISADVPVDMLAETDGKANAQATAPANAQANESTIELMSDEEYPGISFENEAETDDLDEYDSYTLEDILAEREINTDMITDENPETTQFFADDWRLVLINKQRPIPDDYEYVLGTIKGYMQCDERIIDELLLMMQRAKDEGIELVIISPYRDLAHQEQLFTNKINSYMRSGLSYLEAYRNAAHTITVPGTSEHQVGLALDITSREYRSLNAGFAETEAGRWLAENSHEFGFIVRYPKGKEYITGIQFEPWHFRYVGKEAARIIKEEELTLEEFIDKYVS
ncbi:MAG: M15 family metallopeptidase [Lachnospiraceae bacterium]|nr:M15 family metallopeptidase [Lachnospiraceae bacterium]